MTKVAFLLYDFDQGGILTSYLHLCKQLKKIDTSYEFYFLASDCKEFHPEIIKLGKCIHSGSEITKIASILTYIKPDIVQIACKNEYVIACEQAGIKNIIERCDGLRSIDRIDKERVKFAVCHSQGVYNYLMHKGVKNTLIIHNGIELPFLKKEHQEKDRLTIIRITRLGRGKGLDLILDVAKKLTLDTFLIVGGNSKLKKSEKEYERLQNRLKNEQIKNVIMFGNVSHAKIKENIILEADIGVCTSLPLNEGLSNSLLKMMSYGLPVITTNVGDHCELISHYDHIGLLIDSQPEAGTLIRAINQFRDLTIRSVYGINARKVITDYWDIKNTALQYHKLYKEVQ